MAVSERRRQRFRYRRGKPSSPFRTAFHDERTWHRTGSFHVVRNRARAPGTTPLRRQSQRRRVYGCSSIFLRLIAAARTSPSSSSASRMSSSSVTKGGAVLSASATSSSVRTRASVDRRRCRASDSSARDDEPVSNSPDRDDPPRLAQLATDLVHRLLEAVLKAAIRRSPNLLEQLRPRHHVIRATGEEVQHHQRAPFELQHPIAQS